ncbi:MAG: alpha/beta fold hydrolase [Pseudomonadota bacterium]
MLGDIRDVVLLHGIWSHGVSMFVIRRQLEREYGARVRFFNYPSIRGALDSNAGALARFLERAGLEAVHLIGHSLGGVVALRTLATHDNLPPGRLVCLGSPLTGSRAAEFLSKQDWAEGLLGSTLPAGVLRESANEWGSHVCEQREVGIIAGNVPLGVGRIVTNFGGPSDGTVAVSETRLAGARDHLIMPVSHRGMVLSRQVADQAWSFLHRGRFLRERD